MQIPIINGIYTDEAPDFRTSYPKNLIPVPKANGISSGYLRPADGIVEFGEGPGIDRGGINWNGNYYRVMGSKFISISKNGTHTVIGDVGDNGKQVTFDYSFDYLAIASNEQLWLYNGAVLAQNVDPDLGVVLDVKWVDGYFMTTDGEFLVVTELDDPFSVNPLRYGSSEADPDPIVSLLKLRNEIYALNRNSIEVFDNIGATGFPFQRVPGAQIERGSLGTHTTCVFLQSIAFLGGALNESPAIWLGLNGTTRKISTREIDQILQEYTEDALSLCTLEARADKGHQHLYLHLPDKTIVYDGAASAEMGMPVWFILSSGLGADKQYRAKNFVYVYDKWFAGDPTTIKHAEIVDTISSHYGEVIGWEFGTIIVYNEGNGVIFHELELVSLTGRVPLGEDPTISTSYSVDGETWSTVKSIKAGKQGQRQKRLVWLQQGHMEHWRIQRFNGTSDAHISMARLEARMERLYA